MYTVYCAVETGQISALTLSFRWYPGVSDRSGRGSQFVQKTEKSFSLPEE